MTPGEIFEILIATVWINLDHQLRVEIFSNIVYSSPATYFILVIVNEMDCFCWYRRRHKEGVLLKIWDCTPPPSPPPSLWEGLPF